ncbi:hypothetical protein CDAR_118831 [Caerostris darwini]|uniref:Uncharacterized protein n=1 Tax=Caerostris darwini TaxID=1538125 RepID=A0AAV4VAW5_9ARAC|nr:hypothetical protein CDAR_118831 [Caerostris darwini]
MQIILVREFKSVNLRRDDSLWVFRLSWRDLPVLILECINERDPLIYGVGREIFGKVSVLDGGLRIAFKSSRKLMTESSSIVLVGRGAGCHISEYQKCQ